jgi:methyl-accepting chemotaxis protein
MSFVKFFYPGMWVMRKMRFGVKLALISAIVLIPMITIVVAETKTKLEQIAFTRSEAEGVDVVGQLSTLIRLIQTHRGQINIKLLGGDGVQVPVDETRTSLSAAIQGLGTTLDARKHFEAPSEWPKLKARLGTLLSDVKDKSAAQSFALHTALIDDLTLFTYGVADGSGLLYDPDPQAYLLMDMSVSRLIQLREAVGQLRGMGAGLLAETTLNDAQIDQMRWMADKLVTLQRDIDYQRSILEARGFKGESYQGVKEALDAFVASTRLRFKPGSDAGGSKAYYDLGGRATESLGVYQQDVSAALKDSLEQRLASQRLQIVVTTSLSVIAVAGLIYLMLAFNMSFLSDLRQVLRFMKETASGNMRHVVRIRGVDELSDMSDSMGVMVNNISVMVASVRSNSALVAAAGDSLVQSSGSLSDRTEQQAANLEQTSASVQEVANTVKDNAAAASASDSAAQGVRSTAEQGTKEMAQAIESIVAIEASTRRMDEIVGVIDGLAFQTNILALNAAVEAARAGESGRGFAVVAAEVRSLAQRSAASAKEIRQLITTSTAQVEAGVQQIRTAAQNISAIAEGVRGVASNMSVISASSAEQSASLSEITTAIRQLDQITQENATMVEEAVNQATALQTRANVLAEAVSVFKLQQGSADEARALVDRAVEMRHSSGGRDAFIRDVTAQASGLFDRDMYVFVLESSGRYLAFGGNPAKVGTRVQDVPGIDGNALMQSIIRQAEDRPGWVEYEIANPVTGMLQTKMSYVLKIDDVYVGCGVYKSLMASV